MDLLTTVMAEPYTTEDGISTTSFDSVSSRTYRVSMLMTVPWKDPTCASNTVSNHHQTC